VQTAHPGAIRLDGATPSGRAYIAEFGHMHDGTSDLHDAMYHDRDTRTANGWKFSERVYEIKYLDTMPLCRERCLKEGREPANLDPCHLAPAFLCRGAQVCHSRASRLVLWGEGNSRARS
jgi:hypothetical protein